MSTRKLTMMVMDYETADGKQEFQVCRYRQTMDEVVPQFSNLKDTHPPCKEGNACLLELTYEDDGSFQVTAMRRPLPFKGEREPISKTLGVPGPFKEESLRKRLIRRIIAFLKVLGR